MGQIPSKGSHSNIDKLNKKKNKKNSTAGNNNNNKESFRRHSVLNLFQNSHISNKNSGDRKLHKSDLNLNRCAINNSNASLNSSKKSSQYNSTTTINSVRSDKINVKNRVIENLKKRESRSLSPLVKQRIPPLPLQLSKQPQQQQQTHFQLPAPLKLSKNLPKTMVLKPKTNQIYDDYYISKEVLGLGISGKVLSCKCKKTQQKYALKTLRDSVKAKREIDLHWRACQGCPYIVQIVDVYENCINNQKVLLVVMECMEGGELFAKISERSTPFTEQEVAKVMHQICSAVKHLHSMSIAHRDLKPENLLLTSQNDKTSVIKLTDFGFAKEVNLGLVTPCYTPYYVAPEVLGSVKYDISCDIWSLGVIMYILCCGYPPFYSTHGQPISPGMKRRIKAGEFAFPENEWSRVSDEAKDLIKGMLETIPEKRITIDDIMKSLWISQYTTVPQTPLPSLEILREDRDNWQEIQQNMGKALDEMRINWDNKIKIKELPTANNPLLERRMKKKKTTDNTINTTMPPPVNVKNDLIVEDYSRETTMVSMKSVSPANSRPTTPTTMQF